MVIAKLDSLSLHSLTISALLPRGNHFDKMINGFTTCRSLLRMQGYIAALCSTVAYISISALLP
eukprot:scaffold35698_cov63-Attheya_sp.AAC.10